MIPLLRAIVAVGLVLLGAIAVFMGFVFSGAFLKSGVISISWGERADQSRDVLLSETPSDFWFYFVLLAVLPIVLGIAAIVVGRRIERS